MINYTTKMSCIMYNYQYNTASNGRLSQLVQLCYLKQCGFSVFGVWGKNNYCSALFILIIIIIIKGHSSIFIITVQSVNIFTFLRPRRNGTRGKYTILPPPQIWYCREDNNINGKKYETSTSYKYNNIKISRYLDISTLITLSL